MLRVLAKQLQLRQSKQSYDKSLFNNRKFSSNRMKNIYNKNIYNITKFKAMHEMGFVIGTICTPITVLYTATARDEIDIMIVPKMIFSSIIGGIIGGTCSVSVPILLTYYGYLKDEERKEETRQNSIIISEK